MAAERPHRKRQRHRDLLPKLRLRKGKKRNTAAEIWQFVLQRLRDRSSSPCNVRRSLISRTVAVRRLLNALRHAWPTLRSPSSCRYKPGLVPLPIRLRPKHATEWVSADDTRRPLLACEAGRKSCHPVRGCSARARGSSGMGYSCSPSTSVCSSKFAISKLPSWVASLLLAARRVVKVKRQSAQKAKRKRNRWCRSPTSR